MWQRAVGERNVCGSLSALESMPLTGTEGALTPFFLPDGAWIGFFADGKLKKVPVQGGPVRTLAEAPIGFGASWAANSIVFAPANGTALLRVSAEGGTPSAVTELNTARGEFSHRWPDPPPDGRPCASPREPKAAGMTPRSSCSRSGEGRGT